MEVKAKAKYVRISPRKARLVADVVRGLDLNLAFNKLSVMNKKAVQPIGKLLKSALANAEHNLELNQDNLYIKEIRIDEGPTFYRWMPRAFGRATQLRKRTSMFTVILAERVPTKKTDSTKKSAKIETEKRDSKVTDKEIVEKANVAKKETTTKEAMEDHSEEDFDIKRKGGHRNMQQQEQQNKKQSGTLKKMFRRKSGM